MKTYRSGKSLLARVVSAVATLVVIVGVGLVGYSLFIGGGPQALMNALGDNPPPAADTTLSLTVPKMDRVEDLPVYTGPSDNSTGALDTSALHVQGTGFPWEDGANVYIAGHRLGWPGTDSYLVFYDLDRLESGDEVILTDANGTRYTYAIYNKAVVSPSDVWVMEPVPGASVVTLQTCTLPDYSERLLVQAELVSVE
jgi:sortase A